MPFFISEESYKYIKTFMSRANLFIIIVRLFTVKFIITHIHKVLLEYTFDFVKYLGLIKGYLTNHSNTLITLEINHFYTLTDHFIREGKYAGVSSGHYNFPNKFHVLILLQI
jgi:hypothetical protein